MPAKLLLLNDAIQDIQEASRYYNRQQQGLGRRFEKEVKQTFQKIKEAPQAASYASLYHSLRGA